jgi:hypothetical protein
MVGEVQWNLAGGKLIQLIGRMGVLGNKAMNKAAMHNHKSLLEKRSPKESVDSLPENSAVRRQESGNTPEPKPGYVLSPLPGKKGDSYYAATISDADRIIVEKGLNACDYVLEQTLFSSAEIGYSEVALR